jgi:hypothetical protein
MRKAGLPEIYEYTGDPQLSAASSGSFLRPGIYPNWDNTPRSGRRGLVLHGSNPNRFRTHLRAALEIVGRTPREERFIFIKSWNEWAEGNHLEPDLAFGRGYLDVLAAELHAQGGPLRRSE